MSKVFQYLRLREPKRGDVGMELEVEGEGEPLPLVNEKKWRAKEDHSLRGNCMEYVNSEPVKVDGKLRERIEYLTTKLLQPQYRVRTHSPRTSFHVHLNMTDKNLTQVFTACTAYWLLENLLVQYADDGMGTREGNCFCLRLADADYVLDVAKAALKQKYEVLQNLDNDRIRYTGLNLNALPRFGSLEVRTMRGAVDVDVLYPWVTGLHDLICQSTSLYSSPAHLLDEHHKKGPEVILDSLIPGELNRRLKGYYGWTDAIRDSAPLLCELAYTHSWEKWQAKQDKLWEKKEEPAIPPMWNITAGEVQLRRAAVNQFTVGDVAQAMDTLDDVPPNQMVTFHCQNGRAFVVPRVNAIQRGWHGWDMINRGVPISNIPDTYRAVAVIENTVYIEAIR